MVHIGQPVDAKLDGMFLIFIRTLLIDVLYPEVGLAFHEKKPIKAFEIIGSALDPSAQVSKNILTVKELLAPLARDEVKLVRCLTLISFSSDSDVLNVISHGLTFVLVLHPIGSSPTTHFSNLI